MNETSKKDCRSCFYFDNDIDKRPCSGCYSAGDFLNFVPLRAFIDEEPKKETVNSPNHYQLFDGIEVRDVLEVLVNKMYEQGIPSDALFVSDYVQLMQYLMRFMDKNGVEDLKKSRHYLDKMIEAYDG